MKTLLVILQNAYGVEDGYVPSYERESFANSHTGKRLKEALPENVNVRIINANPNIGISSSSCFPPDNGYVYNQIRRIKPNIILACGKIARKVIENIEINIPIVFMPHPAYRALSKKMTSDTRKILESYE